MNGPNEPTKDPRHHLYGVLALYPKSLGDSQGPAVLRMNERNHTCEFQFIACIVENAARGLACVAVPPTISVERVSEFPLEHDLRIGRCVIALVPPAWNGGSACP